MYQLPPNIEHDGIVYFYEVNIKRNWYYYTGPSLHLPREFYQDDIHTPLSFEKMKQIATNNIYRGYLKKNKQGEWEVNEAFFSDVLPTQESVEFYGFKTVEEFTMRRILINWDPSMKLRPSGE